MGDKPSSFVGSREWIGSQEVSYVMSSLLDVDGKFIILDRGSDFLKHVRQLRNHFLLQGTPVMIGGGVLAFTCLGVQWNEEMKECKLLILVGSEVKESTAGSSLHRCGRMGRGSGKEAPDGRLLWRLLRVEELARGVPRQGLLPPLSTDTSITRVPSLFTNRPKHNP